MSPRLPPLMQYSSAVHFSGNRARAMDLAIATVAPLGFRILGKTSSSVDLAGPGLRSSKQNPVLGATRIQLEARDGKLFLEAELGGVRWLSRFVLFFPPGLCLFLFLVMVVVSSVVPRMPLRKAVTASGIGMGILLLTWLPVAPLLIRHLRTSTCRALDTVLHNAALAGGASS